MEASNVPIRIWLLAMYFLVSARSPATNWFAEISDLEPLSGHVEIDETYLGGKDEESTGAKQAVLGDERTHEGHRNRSMPMIQRAVERCTLRMTMGRITNGTIIIRAKQYVMAHTNGIGGYYRGPIFNWSMKHTRRYVTFRLNEGDVRQWFERTPRWLTCLDRRTLRYREQDCHSP